MEYRLIRSRRRTLALEISREAEVVVRAPLHLPRCDIDAFVESRRDWIETHLQKRRARNEAHPPLTPAQTDALRQQAREYLPRRVAFWAERMGLAPAGITVTAARTRFGSCSAKGRLCFSLYLMQYPPEAIDAVVVHELCHLRHMDHSPAFYAEAERWLPDYKARIRLLKQ